MIGIGQRRRIKAPTRGGQRPVGQAHEPPPKANGETTGAAPPPAPGKKNQFHPMQVLRNLGAGKVLSPQQLALAARALTALEIHPQVHGYKQLANQLAAERETEAKGLGALGSRLQGATTDIYKSLAASEAQGLANQQALSSQLNQTSANIASQGQAGLAQFQQGQLGDYTKALEMRGAPGGGSAQAELASAVASQQAAQSANSQAAQQFAAQQGASYGQLRAGLAGANQMQGGVAVGGIGRDVLNRIGASNQKYDEGIQTALAKLADVKATKGSTFIKNLLELRGGEQKFLLGEQAVRGEKAKLAAEKEQNAIQNQQNQEKIGISAAGLALKEWEARHPGASSNDKQEKRQEYRHDVREVRSQIPSLIAEAGRAPKNRKEFNQFVGFANSKIDGVDATIVRNVLENWWNKKRRQDDAKAHGWTE